MCTSNPQVGTTAPTGDQSGNDTAEGGGRPLWPALFITDLTLNGANSHAGDWQQGGTGVPPHMVCGTWKGAVRTVDKTFVPAKITVTPDADPAKNDWNLGSGSDVPPGGFPLGSNQGYGAECVWSVDQLGLVPGHTYRMYFMVHDGDQNKIGGDVGHACTTVHIPDVLATPGPEPATNTLALYQNYPNPFRMLTTIRYAVPERSDVTLAIYDLFGRQVATLVDGEQDAGEHHVTWRAVDPSGRPLAPGVYLYRMNSYSAGTGTHHDLKKMIYVK